jgi:hypothetical protein
VGWLSSNQSSAPDAATAIEEFSRKSVEYVFGDMLGDQVADTILDAVRAAGSRGLTRTEINNLFFRNVAASQIARALGELARRGLASQRKDGSGPADPPKSGWQAMGGRHDQRVGKTPGHSAEHLSVLRKKRNNSARTACRGTSFV